jgi:hypothetical protein
MKLAFDQFPVGMLHNTATNRYHPIVFRPAPSTSDGSGPAKAFRYRSKGHHTAGFDTKEEAMQNIAKQPAFEWSGLEWAWDGVEMPAMTWWFTFDDDQPQEAAAS